MTTSRNSSDKEVWKRIIRGWLNEAASLSFERVDSNIFWDEGAKSI